MKSIETFFRMLVMILPVFALTTCEKPFEAEQEGILKLAVTVDQQDLLKSVLTDSIDFTTHYLIVTVVNEHGEVVMNDERIELYNFGGHWITSEIRLKVGVYELTKFLVIDPAGNVLFAAPIEGSPKSYLVNDPLPVQFEILNNQVTSVMPEVLPVLQDPPEEFGYTTFSFSVVKPLDFFVGVYINDPRLMRPTLLTDALLTVRIDSVWEHSFKLEPVINKVTIRDGYRHYLLIIEKEGYNPVKLWVSHEELVMTTPDQPLMIGIPADSLHLLILQPGPENGKDAMINRNAPDKNFGNHPFIDAINDQLWMNEHMNCPMITRSFIEWDLNQLPKSATIQKAILTLYYPEVIIIDSVKIDSTRTMKLMRNDSSGIPWDYPCAVLQSIVSPWEEYGVTWSNQPETTEENQVFLPLKYYILGTSCVNCFAAPVSEELDVTQMLTNMSGTPHFGMMFKLVNEELPQWFRFASSDFKEPKVWPKLEIYYSLPVLD